MPTLRDYGTIGADGFLWIPVSGGNSWGVSPDTDMREFALGIFMHARETLESLTLKTHDAETMPRANLVKILTNFAYDMEFAEELLREASPKDPD